MSPILTSLGLRQGAAFAPPIPTAVFLRGAYSAPDVANRTELTLEIPAETEAGDLLVMGLLVRDENAVVPPGWERLLSRRSDGETSQQWLQVYTRVAEAGEGGSLVTVTQSSSVQLTGVIIAAAGGGGTPVVNAYTTDDHRYISGGVDQNIASAHLPGGMEVTATDALALSFMSCNYTLTDGSSISIAPPDGMTLLTPTDRAHNRFAAAYRPVTLGDRIDGHFVHGPFPNHASAQASLIISAPGYPTAEPLLMLRDDFLSAPDGSLITNRFYDDLPVKLFPADNPVYRSWGTMATINGGTLILPYSAASTNGVFLDTRYSRNGAIRAKLRYTQISDNAWVGVAARATVSTAAPLSITNAVFGSVRVYPDAESQVRSTHRINNNWGTQLFLEPLGRQLGVEEDLTLEFRYDEDRLRLIVNDGEADYEFIDPHYATREIGTYVGFYWQNCGAEVDEYEVFAPYPRQP